MSEERLHFPTTTQSLEFLFTGLFDEAVTLSKGTPWEPTKQERYILVTYQSDDNIIRALGLVEFPIAAGIASILTRFPNGMVEDTIENKLFSPELLDNITEIMNIASHIFNQNHYLHIKLHKLYIIDKPLTGDLEKAVKSPEARLDVAIETENGYGEGLMSFYKVKEPWAIS